MAFTSGSSTDYIDLLDDLRSWLTGTAGWTQEAWTSPNLMATGATVAAGGSGYSVNDLITLTGGTSTVPTILKVLTLSGNAVATVSIVQPGVYSVAPTNPVAQGSVSPPGGTGATFTMTYTVMAPNKQATVAAVSAGGSGYAVSDTITLTGGTFGQATMLTVTGVSGGAVTTVSITTAGVYTVAPSNPVAQGSTSGGGMGATFTMTYAFVQTDINTLSLSAPGNGATSKVYINIQTNNNVGSNYYGWAVYGATGFTAGISPGSQPGAGGPCFFNLSNSTIGYWFVANTRRFVVEAKVSTNYMSLYGGFFLPFALPTEYPFPLAIIGSYPTLNAPGVGDARNSMISDPGADGCAWYLRRTSQVWAKIENHKTDAAANHPKPGQRVFMWPHKTGRHNEQTATSNIDDWACGGIHNIKTNASGEGLLFLAHIVDMVDGTIAGALDGVYSTTGFGRSTEQQLTYGGRTFRLFQRVGRTGSGDFYAVEEV